MDNNNNTHVSKEDRKLINKKKHNKQHELISSNIDQTPTVITNGYHSKPE